MEIDFKKQRQVADYQLFYEDKYGKSMDDVILIETEDAVICHPWYDETLRFEVNPLTYYGESFINSLWCKEQFELTEQQYDEMYIEPELSTREYTELMEALKNFKETYVRLNEKWQPRIDLAEMYPFHKSFDEIGIVEWCNRSIEFILKKVMNHELDN